MKVNSPEKIVKLLTDAGIKKDKKSTINLLILGFLAGAFIAFGGLVAIKIASGLSDEIWGSISTLIFASLFPIGLIIIIFTGSELATGNMTTQPLAWFSGNINFKDVIKNWTLVFIANIIGSLFVAYFFAYLSGILTAGNQASYVVNLANSKVSLNWFEAFLRGVGCNWLVGLAIWFSFASDSILGKIAGIWWPIMTFVAIGFEHSIANAFFIPAGLIIGNSASYTGPILNASWSSFLMNNLIPVTLGNIIGAAVFVSLTSWYVYSNKSSKDINSTNLKESA